MTCVRVAHLIEIISNKCRTDSALSVLSWAAKDAVSALLYLRSSRNMSTDARWDYVQHGQVVRVSDSGIPGARPAVTRAKSNQERCERARSETLTTNQAARRLWSHNNTCTQHRTQQRTPQHMDTTRRKWPWRVAEKIKHTISTRSTVPLTNQH